MYSTIFICFILYETFYYFYAFFIYHQVNKFFVIHDLLVVQISLIIINSTASVTDLETFQLSINCCSCIFIIYSNIKLPVLFLFLHCL